MSKKKVNSKEDFINEPKVVALPGQTYSYGQTPAALCRQHFKEIAEHLNMNVEELARGVLNKSVGDQLAMLKDFYKSKFQETETIYQPLLDLYSDKKFENEESPEKSSPKKRKTNEPVCAVPKRINKFRPLVLSGESESEDKTNKADAKPLNKTKQRDRKPVNQRSAALNATLSRIQSSIEDTIAFTSTSETNDNEALKLPNQEPKEMVDLNTDKPEEIKEKLTKISAYNSQSISDQANQITKESTEEPKTVIDVVPGTSETTILDEDLETFLFGKSLPKSKPPPPKKCKQHSLEAFSDSQSNQPSITKESTKEPKTVIDLVAGPSKTTIPEEEDLETFLFGKSPVKSKPPPKKKFQKYSREALSQSTIERTKHFILDEFDSPPSSQYSTPGLTFESASCSPLSRQRDLLSVARDIAALQKVVASGKKLGDSVSVSDTIKFTN